MKRIVGWVLILIFALVMRVDAEEKEKYIIQIEISNATESIKTNLAFSVEGLAFPEYEYFENGFYYLVNPEEEVSANERVYRFEGFKTLETASFKFIVDNKDGRFKTEAFQCNFIKDRDGNNVCYQDYDYTGRYIKDTTNMEVISNALVALKVNVFPITITVLLLAALAIIYNQVVRLKGYTKPLINTDLFYVIFSVGIFLLAIILYTVNIFNFYSQLVLLSVLLAVYYLIYYLSKYVAVRKLGIWTLFYSLLTYALALCLTVLVFSYYL